jgi:NhaC family Na+:H+ antiporter
VPRPVTSVLVPWNTCGAYISGVLGVPTASYLPYCFFNIASTILDVVHGFIGFKVPSAEDVADHAEPKEPPNQVPADARTRADDAGDVAPGTRKPAGGAG